MAIIQLLYVKNVITRHEKKVQQELSFFMSVENISYDKKIDVLWAGEDGLWHELPVCFHSNAGTNKEYWQAKTTLKLSEKQSLAGNIQFCLRCQVAKREHWDNNGGLNYISEADSGVFLAQNQLVQNIDFDNFLNDSGDIVSITFAVNKALNVEKAQIHWTTDNWLTTHKTPCKFDRLYWHNAFQSNARNPNQYGSQLWVGKIKYGEASKLQYAICCESDDNIIWDNNNDLDYVLQGKQLKILILNLHCYQEENQDEKFTTIAHAIDELDVDIVCLQEVAEYWNDGHGDWQSNSAKIINDRLTKPFHIHTDWSHLGFDKYREGVAILSRYVISHPESRYVSDSDDIYDIHSRKVVKAQIHIPHFGPINVFSAHLSWIEDGFQQQFERLHEWAKNRNTSEVKATLLCGDFNITAGTSGYGLVVNSNDYEDQFLAANHHGVFEQIFKVNDPHWQNLLADDYRIDYIFMNKKSALKVTSADIIFTDQDYGRVSDHYGHLMSFEAKNDEFNIE